MRQLVFILLGTWLLANSPTTLAQTQPSTTAPCPGDTMECPDGTVVGRSGPDCSFSCPLVTTITGTTSNFGKNQADELTTSPTNDPQEQSGERSPRQENRQEIRDTRQLALTEVRQQRIMNLAANISNRMDAAVNRLYSIVNRLETRITKTAASGVDTIPATRELQQAAAALAEARVMLAGIDAKVVEATLSTEPLAKWRLLQTHYRTIGGHIRTAHGALRATISAIKNAPVIPSPAPAEIAPNESDPVPEENASTTP